MLKKYFLLFLIVTVVKYSFSQNLVPDGSFEQDTACPNAGNVNFNLYWINPTTGSPDYFHTCSSSPLLSVPSNFIGGQPAFGGAYVGGVTKMAGDFREYVQVRLLDSLQTGISYCITYYVSLAGKSGYATAAPQLYFSDSAISSTGSSYFPYIPQIFNPSIITDTTNWTLISGTYNANGGEKYITIGNFYSEMNTPSVFISFSALFAYFYIDNVLVINCDSVNSVNDYNSNSEMSIFPNPSSGIFTIESSQQISQVEIFDVLGEKIYSQNLTSEKPQIDLSDKPKGIYCIQVNTGEKIYSQKIIIQ